ncbi:hypothetical protein [Marilutibacter spongiae]|uniref:Uncharacterized protein n=1 Tax=Marilutibacter spongiae TaxID=2025720 RepID=A0A7W3TKI7_9GAMM|nr:hypothetical protein [Lysobacter spongiae]MBB1060040.1 hypothetical protein [Lysobacter spongiae]
MLTYDFPKRQGGPQARARLCAAARCLPVLLLLSAAACSSPSGDARAPATGGVASFEALAGGGAPVGQGPEAWARWLDSPWKADDGDAPSYRVSRLACPGGECEVAEEAMVDTCRALFDADLRNLEADREARSSYQDWRLKCYAGRAIAQADIAADSHLADFAMEANGYRRLPAALGFPSGPAQVAAIVEIQAAHGDLGAFIDQVLTGVTAVTAADAPPRQVSIADDEEWTRSWTWLARGDINHDGHEDLLVAASLHDSATRALYAHRLFVVERPTADAPLSLAQEISLVAGPVVCDPYVAHCEREIVQAADAEQAALAPSATE